MHFIITLVVCSAALSFVMAQDDIDWSEVQLFAPQPEMLQTKARALTPQARLLGGISATNPIPFHVGLLIYPRAERASKSLCGGTLISTKTVLTAAHCFIQRCEVLIVVLGAIQLGYVEPARIKQTVLCKSVIKHKKFNSINYLNDIAIVPLEHEISPNRNIQPVKMPNANDGCKQYSRVPATISGWGEAGDGEAAPVLRSIQSTIINIKKCKEMIRTPTDNNICLDGSGLKSICTGDSGGPLTITNERDEEVLIGIASYVPNWDCAEGNPSVFTRVDVYLDWIKENSE